MGFQNSLIIWNGAMVANESAYPIPDPTTTGIAMFDDNGDAENNAAGPIDVFQNTTTIYFTVEPTLLGSMDLVTYTYPDHNFNASFMSIVITPLSLSTA